MAPFIDIVAKVRTKNKFIFHDNIFSLFLRAYFYWKAWMG